MKLYLYGGVLVLILALAAALFVQTKRVATLKREFAEFRGGVAAVGAAAKRKAADDTLADKLKKESADAENLRLRTALAGAVKLLRDERARRGGLPAAPAGSSRPDLACFDRSEFERAYGAFVEDVRRVADEGAAATLDLNTAKDWASQRR